jgi:hypothetical protein
MLITRPQPHVEAWTHPRTGEKLTCTYLGACRHGRLALKRCPETGGMQVYWLGRDLSRETLDDTLLATITKGDAMAFAATRLNDDSAMGFFWLGLLPPGDYRLEERVEGGMALYCTLSGSNRCTVDIITPPRGSATGH